VERESKLPSNDTKGITIDTGENAASKVSSSNSVGILYSRRTHCLGKHTATGSEPAFNDGHLESKRNQVACGSQTGKAGANNEDGRGRRRGRRLWGKREDGGGEAEIDVCVLRQEGMRRGNKGSVLGSNGCERGVGGNGGEGIRTPEGHNVIADDKVVGLLGAANAWEHGGHDLVLGEGVRREPRSESDEGLRIELPGEAEGG
jgi:hypothetical protein